MHPGAWPLELGRWIQNPHTLTERLLCRLLIYCVARLRHDVLGGG